jgi:hypothetical protein
VESAEPLLAAGAAWSISTTPGVEIGVTDGDSTQTLDGVEGALRLSDGRIVIANGANPILRWYDPRGTYLHGTGRYGQGPGEFDGGEGAAWIYALWALPGDSIATWEHSRRKMQVFDPQGQYKRAVTIDLPPNMPPAAYPQASGPIAGGLIAILHPEREEVPGDPLGVVRRDSAAFLRYSGDGKFARELARLPGYVQYLGEFQNRGRAVRAVMRPPFSASFVASPNGDRFYYGDTERYEIAVYDTSGTVRTLIRRPGSRRPVTPRLIDQHRQRQLGLAGNDPVRRRDTERHLEATPFPDSLPAYRRLRIDREGMMWVQEYDLPGATSVSWSVFASDGRWITDVAVPVKWRIVDIGRDYILTVESDELGVERVRMYALTRV